MTTRGSLAEIVEALRAGRSFVVTSHDHPDGDAVGSALAMTHLLRALGKTDIHCVLSGPVPRIYQWLPGADCVTLAEAGVPACDTLVVVDVAQRERFEEVARRVNTGAKAVVVDHHPEPVPYGDVVFIDSTYAAVGEILVALFEAADTPLTRDAATCAYVAQTTDTGGFRFSNTSARSHRIAARLLDTGLDVADISRRVFDEMSLPKAMLLEKVLARRVLCMEGRVAYAEMSARDMAEAGASDEDVDGLVNYLRNLAGVEVSILFRELETHKTKVSVRSFDAVNAGTFLEQFGGGGHRAAAGATVPLPMHEVRDVVLRALTSVLEKA